MLVCFDSLVVRASRLIFLAGMPVFFLFFFLDCSGEGAGRGAIIFVLTVSRVPYKGFGARAVHGTFRTVTVGGGSRGLPFILSRKRGD